MAYLAPETNFCAIHEMANCIFLHLFAVGIHIKSNFLTCGIQVLMYFICILFSRIFIKIFIKNKWRIRILRFASLGMMIQVKVKSAKFVSSDDIDTRN
jgi:hypothetical protein